MNSWLRPAVLTGSIVQLIPLEKHHKTALLSAVSDGQLWDLWYTSTPSPSTIEQYIETALHQQQAGRSLPFVVLHLASNQIIGTTRYCHADPANRRLEIGYTWYGKSHQRTGVNTECKYLLLRHAFDTLDCIAVEFRTHWHNHPSRRAILRLGAKQDGILRHHRLDPDGGFRDTVVFSIIRPEWPTVRNSLRFKMQQQFKLQA